MARVAVRLPDDLLKRVQAASRSRDSSLNQLIVKAIGEALAPDEKARNGLSPLAIQVECIRSAFGDLAVELDASVLPLELRPAEGLPDPEKIACGTG